MNVVITGGNRGIGFEFVKQLIIRDCNITATYRDEKKSEDLLKLAGSVKNLTLKHADIKNGIEGISGPIDLLINNSGVYLDKAEKVDEFKIETLKNTLDVNLYGAIRTVQSLLPALRQSKDPRIIQISSMMGSIADNGSSGALAYRISKAALNMFNKNLSIDFPEIISVVLHPGWVKTEMGGPNAKISTEQSVKGMLKVIGGLKKSDSGKFIDWSGKEIPW